MSFFSEYNDVRQLLQQRQQVIFYAESRHYYQYFRKLLDDLLAENIPVCYITSDNKDELITRAPAGMKVIYVKWLIGFLFSRIQTDVMIMTMPDLGNSLFKRSPGVGTYIYIFHAAVSVHQQYNRDAFFHYDTVFCTGDYQEKEIRAMEKIYNQREKEIVRYGYPLFDLLKEKVVENKIEKTILVAPSWFNGCIFDTCIVELLEKLSAEPYKVFIRFHPEYEKRKKKDARLVQKMINRYSNMFVDYLPDVADRLSSTDLLITDRSGIAFEFALGVKRPVLFIDTTLKETNKEWQKLEIEPIENSLRSAIGISLKTTELGKLGESIKQAAEKAGNFNAEVNHLLQHFFYNSAQSYAAGVRYIRGKINKE